LDTSGLVYPENDPCNIHMPSDMLKVAQAQYSNNYDARVVRYRELLCPFLGDFNSRNDYIIISIENSLIADADLAEVLCLEVTELMQIWETRPISIFDCLNPACRTSISVRNRTHLLQLLRLDRYFGLKVGAMDPVKITTLCEMLCESCVQGLQHSCAEQHWAELSIRQVRIAELRKMPFEEYRLTPEWRARRNRVLLRAGNKCELCYASGLIDVHHRTYERYGDELHNDLIALCRPCHQQHHGIPPEAA
jgi:hypothetical protein